MRVKDAVGRFGEDTAARHLTAAGFTILDRNWRPGPKAPGGIRGELDIVAREGDALVIVEVKTRSGTGFGSPAESVTADKVRRIRRLAVLWLAAHSGTDAAPGGPSSHGGHRVPRGHGVVRFDVVSVLRSRDGVTVEHLRGAF
jgi:putative endonuclease